MIANAAAALVAWIVASGASDGAGTPAPVRPGRALFERAEASFRGGRFEQARADYQAAYDVEPLPAFLFNIGQCYRNLGDYERAKTFFDRFTALDPRSANRPAAERLSVEMSRLGGERRAQAQAPAPPPSLAAPPQDDPERALLQQGATPAPAARPAFYRRGWFWVGVGGAVLLGGAAALALSSGDPGGTLRPIDAR
jgi:tetratricopeptide (TPR) repeat protein